MGSRLRASLFAVTAGLLGVLVAHPAAAQKGDPPSPPPVPVVPPETPPETPPAPPPPGPPAARRAVPPRVPVVRRSVKRPAWVPRGRRLVDAPLIAGLPIASFPGFARLEDGKSRIFVEVMAKVEIFEKRDPARLVYKLRNTAVTQATNALPLITSYFSTPVERVQLIQDGMDVNVVIELREATSPMFQVVDTPRGIVLWVDFPRSTTWRRPDDPTTIDMDAPSNSARILTTTQRLGPLQGPGGGDLPPAAAPVAPIAPIAPGPPAN